MVFNNFANEPIATARPRRTPRRPEEQIFEDFLSEIEPVPEPDFELSRKKQRISLERKEAIAEIDRLTETTRRLFPSWTMEGWGETGTPDAPVKRVEQSLLWTKSLGKPPGADLDIALNKLVELANENPEQFVEKITSEGRTPDSENLLWIFVEGSVHPDGTPYSPEEIEGVIDEIFGETPSFYRSPEIAAQAQSMAISPGMTFEGIDAAILAQDEFLFFIKQTGRTPRTESLVSDLFPGISEEQKGALFGEEPVLPEAPITEEIREPLDIYAFPQPTPEQVAKPFDILTNAFKAGVPILQIPDALEVLNTALRAFKAAALSPSIGARPETAPNIVEAVKAFLPGGEALTAVEETEFPGIRFPEAFERVADILGAGVPALQLVNILKDEQGKVGVKGLVEILPFFIADAPALVRLA
ncbi:MAG: hypothetical protein V3V88_04405, partial [Dehalococcoidia bacterium]